MKLRKPKLLRPKKALLLLTTVVATTALITATTPAFAAFSMGTAFSDLVKKQKISLFGISPDKIASYVTKDGELNFNTVFSGVSQIAYDLLKGKGSDVKTAGDQIADFNQDKSEISHQVNTVSTSKSLKFFEDNADQTQQITTENETASDSSLEAADKANKLSAANIVTAQQLTKATLDLATAQQNQNSIEIQKGQIARTDRLKDQIGSAFGDNESERIQAVVRRRFYPDATGQMVEGNADASTRVFNKK
jgi:hypothetical protein